MPNLVGIGNSQVPTNAMLGGLAYQDSVGEINIDEIKAKTGDSATDVFVYDTRKDSDGGAWRHRTKNTSWYNEGLSETRGARKEFPAVAVIVASTTSLTIYDGDDPNLSLWMKFISGSGGDKIFNRPQYWNNSAVYALNGIVCATNVLAAAESTLALNYVSDSAILYPIDGYPTFGGKFNATISERSNNSITFKTIPQNICGDETYDVAMTVLPNAPIDVNTGLPIPTIAVGTGHGTTVIDDNGIAKDIVATTGGYTRSRDLEIVDSILYVLQDPRLLYTFALPWNKDTSGGTLGGYDGIVWLNDLQNTVNAASNCQITVKKNKDVIVGTPSELVMVYPDGDHKNSMTNYFRDEHGRMAASIGKDHNSGWMFGKQGIATMCDCLEPVDEGKNYVLNPRGTLNTGWTAGGGGTFTTTGVFQYVISGGGNHAVYQQISGLTIGKRYKFTYTHKNGTTSAYIGPNASSADPNQYMGDSTGSSDITKSIVWYAYQTTAYVVIYGIGNGTHQWDNVSVVETNDVFGQEKVNNGFFGANISGWTAGANTTLSHDGGQLRVTSTSSGSATAYQQLTKLIPGNTYAVNAYVHNASGSSAQNGARLEVSTSTTVSTSMINYTETVPQAQWISVHMNFTASSSTMYLHCASMATSSGRYSVFDSITMRECIRDSSIKNLAMHVRGHLTRQPVAPGAELHSYGGFNDSAPYGGSRLSLPFSSQFGYGTNGFCVMLWFKTTGGASSSEQFFRKGIPSSDHGAYEGYVTHVGGSGNIRFVIKDDDGSSATVLNSAQLGWNDGIWHHYVGIRLKGTMFLYLDGKLNNTGATDASHSTTWGSMSEVLEIGSVGGLANGASNTEMALFRVSGGVNQVPNEGQIKKIYDEEKKLFAPNAKCSLYGTSNDVNAVAYDDSTDTVHVGTSSGRSEFRGLNRINNTTTAVTTAISASNELVAEQ